MEFYLKNKLLSIVFLFLLLFASCKNEEKAAQKNIKKAEEYTMYQPSEMAGFMNALYAYNSQVKQQIIAGEIPSSMPLDLMKLHSAEMSVGKSRTETWNNYVNTFIESQQAVVNKLSNTNLKERYNNSINNCLSCHKTECVGPIPKIKKLLIKQ